MIKRQLNPEFLVVTWEGKSGGQVTSSYSYQVVKLDALFEVLDKAHEDGDRIAVHEIGKCILDWS